jgi:uncharacterized DUF497 family protein
MELRYFRQDAVKGRFDPFSLNLIIFTIRKRNKEQFIRPVSARYMHQKEVKYYEEEITNLEE